LADVLDVAYKIANDISAVVVPFVGLSYTIPDSVDSATYGTQTVPPILVAPGTVQLRKVMNRLEQGQATIGVEFDETFDSTPQYLDDGIFYDPPTPPVPALAVSVATNVVTLSGTIQAGDVVGITQGNRGGSYLLTGSESLTTAAANLAAACVTAGMTATSNGAAVTITSGGFVTASVGTTYNRTYESWRRRKNFFVTLWAANMWDRQYIGKLIETTYTPPARLTLADGTIATILGMDGAGFDTKDFDEQQRDMTYIRRVRLYVDFIATTTTPVTQVVATAEGATYNPAWAANINPPAAYVPPTTSQL
jgi:hypothetical protein